MAMDALIIASVFQRCQVKKQLSILSFALRGKPLKLDCHLNEVHLLFIEAIKVLTVLD